MKVLISGASIAGPVLAYWLSRRGFSVTVVERAAGLRKTGGHAVDLFRPAMDISEQMGVLDLVEAHATGTTSLTVHRDGGGKPVTVEYRKLVAAMSDRHVEIMRDDLSQIYFDASCQDAEYIFDDEITSIAEGGEVTFAKSSPRRFDIVVGADGLHSGVRRLTFGSDSGDSRFLGAYLAVLSVPKKLAREGDLLTYLGAGQRLRPHRRQRIGAVDRAWCPRIRRCRPRCRGAAQPSHSITGETQQQLCPAVRQPDGTRLSVCELTPAVTGKCSGGR